jgi:hypothetical protein
MVALFSQIAVRNAMRTIISILTILILTNTSVKLFACSCVGQKTVQEEVKYSDAVLVGKIVSNNLVSLTDSTFLKMFPNDTIMKTPARLSVSLRP